ncbi:MAG: DUF1326 domain-containing protein [Gemmatimonadaceae bacterium]
MATAATQSREQAAYRVRAQSVEACNCQHGCNCQFGGFPNEGKCEFVIGYEVEDGRFGDVDLDGLRAVVAAKYPRAIHEGHGHVVLFIDEKAPQEQVDAFVTILSGQAGGMPWEAIAGTIERFEGPVRKPIELNIDGQRAHVRVPGAVELETAPLRDPVTGKEKEVHVTYPKGGFFWNDGNVVTTNTMRASYGDMRMDWPNKYAATAEVNWTNQH